MKPRKRKRAYICEIAFDYELGETDVELFSSLEQLERNHCGACGVYLVEVRVLSVAKEAKQTGRRYDPAKINRKMIHEIEIEMRKTQRFLTNLKKRQEKLDRAR